MIREIGVEAFAYVIETVLSDLDVERVMKRDGASSEPF